MCWTTTTSDSDSPARQAPPRLFFAFWPPGEIIPEIMDWAHWARSIFGGRVMQPDTLHLTLAFLGATPPERAAELAKAASMWRVPTGTVVLSELGRFKGPRVVWAGPSSHDVACQDWLRGVHAHLRSELRRFGVALAEDRFRPHVSLLRDVRSDAAPHGQSADLQAYRPTLWEPARCVLVASQPRPGASSYRVLARVALGA